MLFRLQSLGISRGARFGVFYYILDFTYIAYAREFRVIGTIAYLAPHGRGWGGPRAPVITIAFGNVEGGFLNLEKPDCDSLHRLLIHSGEQDQEPLSSL